MGACRAIVVSLELAGEFISLSAACRTFVAFLEFITHAVATSKGEAFTI